MSNGNVPWWLGGLIGGALGYLGAEMLSGRGNGARANPVVSVPGGGQFRFDAVGPQDYEVYWRYGSKATIGKIAPKTWMPIGRVWNFVGQGHSPKWRTNYGFARTRMEGALDLLEKAEEHDEVQVPFGVWIEAGR